MTTPVPQQLATLVDPVRPGGVVVNTTVWMPAPTDARRGVRGVDLHVRSDAAQLALPSGKVVVVPGP